MSRVGAIAALSLTTVLIAGAAVVWNSSSHRSAAPAQPVRSAPTATNAGTGADSDTSALVRQAGGAIRGRDSAALSRYLAKGVDPNSIDADGETLLNKAVLHGTPSMVEMLLNAGADPDLPGEKGLGPLALAALAGHHEMLERLVEASKTHREAAGLAASRDTEAEPRGGSSLDPAMASAGATDDAVAGAVTDAGGSAGADPANGADPVANGAAEATPDLQQSAFVEAAAPATGPDVTHVLEGGQEDTYHFAPPPAKAAHGGSPSAPDGGSSVGSAATASLDPAPTPQDTANPLRDQAPPEAAAPAQAESAEPGPGGAPKNWVFAAQKRLAQLGYYKGTADGIAGSQTSAAIKSYQTVAGIAVNGVVSAELLTRIGASVEAPQQANSAAAYRPPETGGSAPRPGNEEAEAQALQNVLNKFQTDLGQNFNSETRPDALRRYCQRNANTWVYDEAARRSVFCRDIVGLAPR